AGPLTDSAAAGAGVGDDAGLGAGLGGAGATTGATGATEASFVAISLARAAAIISEQVPNRSSRDRAMALATTGSIPFGNSGRRSVTDGRSSAMWAYITAASCSRRNGGSPVKHSKRTQPSAYWSA